jgi:hypothetical protein
MRNIWQHGRVVVVGIALVAMVTAGGADARKRGVGKTVEGSEVTDNTLTGVDIDESTLQCTGPGGIPGCGVAGPGTPSAPPSTPPSAPTITLGTPATVTIGFPAVKSGLATSACPAGTTAIGGNVSWDNNQDADDTIIQESGQTGPNSWYALAVDGPNNNHPVTLRVVAICLS